MTAVHPRVYADAGKWYFWRENASSYEGPFETDWQASREAYACELGHTTAQGKLDLDADIPLPIAAQLNNLSAICRRLNDQWWRDPDTLAPIERNNGQLIALMHSELSEAFEGLRRGRVDEHLPHRKSVEVELADLLIRVFDFAGEHGLDLGGALVEKCRYNLARADHRPENRRAGVEGAKKF